MIAGLGGAGFVDGGGAQGAASRAESRPPWLQIDRPSVEACGGCHAEVYNEWSKTLHFFAWTNANVRDATRNFEMSGCRACHSPKSVYETGFDKRPAFREFNQNDGVHCLSCHGMKDGVAAARTIPDAPCRPQAEPGLQKAESCYPCHEPTHQAFTEYYTSKAYKQNTRCMDCHMPARASGGRSHGPNGGLNPEFVKKGVDWNCEVRGGDLILTLTNRTGHKFPGEIPSRSFVIKWEIAGAPPVYETLRKANKGEVREDNRLGPDETRELKFTIPAAPAKATLTLLFKPYPVMPDEASQVIGVWSR